MQLPCALALALAGLTAARSIPSSAVPGIKTRYDAKARAVLDQRLASSSHPLLGGVPVPRTPEEIEAAKQPGYIYWAAEQQAAKRSLQARECTLSAELPTDSDRS